MAGNDEAQESRHHPLLMGGGRRRKYGHGYSSRQMECLSAICGTFIGPTPLAAPYVLGKGDLPNKHVREFYGASGSENGIPEEVTMLLSCPSPPISAPSCFA
ncbi:Long-chain-alcohol oxidase [Nymphaea thermarum]|nr:Long-chain-alcohol oxidase [Nymphaea thermarum]